MIYEIIFPIKFVYVTRKVLREGLKRSFSIFLRGCNLSNLSTISTAKVIKNYFAGKIIYSLSVYEMFLQCFVPLPSLKARSVYSLRRI